MHEKVTGKAAKRDEAAQMMREIELVSRKYGFDIASISTELNASYYNGTLHVVLKETHDRQ